MDTVQYKNRLFTPFLLSHLDNFLLRFRWNQLGYLQVRDSVVVNVSYFFHFKDDPTIITGSERANVKRAAALLYSTAEFRKGVCSGAMEPEVLGRQKIPLDSVAYKYMFNASRIPRRVQDTYRIYDPSRYAHAIVARKGNFFSINIVDKETGNPLPLSVLEEQLEQCINMADNIPSSRAKLGILTSTNRDTWADARETLLASGGDVMGKALEALESGAVVINLDDTNHTDIVKCSEMFLTGSKQSGDNRWFDKSIQLIVDNNGQAGCINEHSMMDGMPAVKYVDYITGTTYDEVKKRSVDAVADEPTYEPSDIFAEALENMDPNRLQEMESTGMYQRRLPVL
jgi:carnitine O-acetyltransferase